MDWSQILVYLLAVLFAVFLVMAIVLVLLLVKVSVQIRSAVKNVESTMISFEKSVDTFKRATIPMVVTKNVVEQIIGALNRKDPKN